MIRVLFRDKGFLLDALQKYIERAPDWIYRTALTWGYADAIPAVREVLEPHKRTGKLARGLRWEVSRFRKSVRMRLVGNVPYWRIQEVGGVINAKPGGWLTVPLPAALDARGVARRARTYPNTFIARSKVGNLLIFQKQGGGQIVPLFVLRKSVKLPGLQYGARGVSKAMPQLFRRLDEEVRGANI